MNLVMSKCHADGYKSGSQIARRITEAWAGDNLFCASCDCKNIDTAPCNTKATDFVCPNCNAHYQLKAGKGWSEHRVPDAGYFAMIEAIRSDRTPNLLVMQYTSDWNIRNLMLVPSFFFNESAIEKRKPLSVNARRAGWIGCNILLSAIAPEGKIRIVESGRVNPVGSIREHYEKLRPLTEITAKIRGWTLDVLRLVRDLNKPMFRLDEIYSKEIALQVLHPNNKNIRAKIRQQLQVLRDLDFIRFVGNGTYELSSETIQ